MHIGSVGGDGMADDAGAGEPELIKIHAIDISPNNCILQAPLDINVDFDALDHFPAAYWEIKVR